MIALEFENIRNFFFQVKFENRKEEITHHGSHVRVQMGCNNR